MIVYVYEVMYILQGMKIKVIRKLHVGRYVAYVTYWLVRGSGLSVGLLSLYIDDASHMCNSSYIGGSIVFPFPEEAAWDNGLCSSYALFLSIETSFLLELERASVKRQNGCIVLLYTHTIHIPFSFLHLGIICIRIITTTNTREVATALTLNPSAIPEVM